MKKNPLVLGIVLVLFLALPAFAAPLGMTFEGLGDWESVSNYYSGGAGPNYAVSFGPEALALISYAAGGSGNFINAPSGSTALFSLSDSFTMNMTAGFSTGLSFFYSAAAGGSVSVYDGLDGTGNLLASLNLAAMTLPNDIYDVWAPIGIGFAGIAESVVFSSANAIAFDNITLNSTTPVPVPPGVWLFGSSLLGLVGFRKKFRG